MIKDFIPYESYFLYSKIMILLVIVVLKLFHIRNEIQCLFNHTSKLIQDTMLHPSKENLDTCTKKCRALATMAWPVTHSSLSCCFYILLLIVLLLSKGGVNSDYPKMITSSVVIENSTIGLDEDEFIIREGQGFVNIVKNITYVEEIQRLKDVISLIKAGENGGVLENVFTISKNTLVHHVFYRDFCEFFIWSTFLGWSFITVICFVILNINPGKTKTS